MCLLVRHHLNAVFNCAQKEIRSLQRSSDRRRDPSLCHQNRQRIERARRAQFAPPPARNQLLSLNEKLDLANPASAQLDVVARNADYPKTLMSMNLALHRVHIGDGCKIEILAPDERCQLSEQRIPRNDISCDSPRFDERRPLPILANGLIVMQRRIGRERNLRRASIGPQPQIGAKHIAIGRALRQQANEIARQSDKQVGGFKPWPHTRQRGFVKYDQIDIARIIKFISAVFSHANHDVTRVDIGPQFIVRDPIAARRRRAKQEPHRRLNRPISRPCQRVCDRHNGPHAAQISKPSQQRHFSLEHPQQVHHLGKLGRLRYVAAKSLDGCSEVGSRRQR